VRNEALRRVKEETNIVQTIKGRKAIAIGREDEEEDISYQMALMKNTGYWKLKEEALDFASWRPRFGRGYGPFVRQITE